jgi:squalene synthase HpnC
LALTHYENFSVASVLLPRRLLRHFHNIYAYCRWADDLGDETGGGEQALDLLQWWREELLTCYGGRPNHPVMIALKETIDAFGIPAQPFLDLLSAFEQDQRVKTYDSFHQLLDYCRRSANPVGHLILYLGECFDTQRAALSDCICTALQLTNFWQDVGRDLDIGRIYLPLEDFVRFGYSLDELHSRQFTPAFASMLSFQVQRTRSLFERGAPLIELMPDDLQVDVELFLRGGLSILDRIEAQQFDVLRRRPKLGKAAKAELLLRTVLGRWWRNAGRRTVSRAGSTR